MTKTAMNKLFDGLEPEETGLVAAALADFARPDRPNSGHRLPKELAVRVRDFAVDCGVDPSAVTVSDPAYGFCSVRFPKGVPGAFANKLRAVNAGNETIQLDIAMNGNAEALVHMCADEDRAERPEGAGAPGTGQAEQTGPAVAKALTDAAARFLEEIGPLSGIADSRIRICTPRQWDDFTIFFDSTPELPDDIDVGEFEVCVREMVRAARDKGMPSLSAIETALMFLGQRPELPDKVRRAFFALSDGADNAQPFVGRYVFDEDRLPNFRLLLADLPGQQYMTAGPGTNPMRRYLSNKSDSLEALRSAKGIPAAAFLGFGSAFLARKGPEVLEFASDAKKFWEYVRCLYTQWIKFGNSDIGAKFDGGQLKLMFHPFTRIGMKLDTDANFSYAIKSEAKAVVEADVVHVAGAFDGDFRGSEFDYDPFEAVYDEDDRPNERTREADSFDNTAAAAIYGFAIVPSNAAVSDGVAWDKPFHVTTAEADSADGAEADGAEADSTDSTDSADGADSTDGRLKVSDLPLEWSALIHGLDIHETRELRDTFAKPDWAQRICWTMDANTSLPVRPLPRDSAQEMAPPAMDTFVSEIIRAFRAMTNSEIVSTDDMSEYSVPSAHDQSKYVTAVYTGMTTDDASVFPVPSNRGPEPEPIPSTFSVPSFLLSDIVANQRVGFYDVAENANESLIRKTVTAWIDHLGSHPGVQLKCAKRRTGSKSPRTAWVVVETNFSFADVTHCCAQLGQHGHIIGSNNESRTAKDVIRAIFVDSVVRGMVEPFSRFFESATNLPRFHEHGFCEHVGRAAAAANAGLQATAAAVVVDQSTPSTFTAYNPFASFDWTPTSWFNDVRVSLMPDSYGRAILVVAVLGSVANVARLRYRAANPENPRFRVFTASMMKAYDRMVSSTAVDVPVSPDASAPVVRETLFNAMRRRIKFRSVSQEPPKGRLSPLMLSPREDYPSEVPWSRDEYIFSCSPVDAVHAYVEVDAVTGRVVNVPGFDA